MPADMDELVSALTRSWDAIRTRHREVPPVVLAVGSHRRKAKLPCLGGFVPARWSPVQAREPPRLRALREEFDDAIARGDLVAAMGASGEAMLIRALQLSADATRFLDEVFITDRGLSGTSADVLGILLPWRRGRIQTLGMPSRDRASSCSACWNVGNPKGCQSDVGNLDGCPHRVISTGGDWIWNPNAAATATSTASKMKIISANGIEPAADSRSAKGERKRGSALPLVVQLALIPRRRRR